MPRRNRPKRPREPWTPVEQMKPKGKKRPRGWHRGQNQDGDYLRAVAKLHEEAA